MLISDLSDSALANEWHLWNRKIITATSWGASLAAANEFRQECEHEIDRRNLSVEGYNAKQKP